MNVIPPYMGMNRYDDGLPLEMSAITCPIQYNDKNQRWTYSVNHQMGSEAQGLTPSGTQVPVQLRFMERAGVVQAGRWPCLPSTVPYALDGDAVGATGSWKAWRIRNHDPGYLQAAGIPRSYPHNLSANLLFLDGHVENMVRGTQVFENPGSGAAIPRYAATASLSVKNAF